MIYSSFVCVWLISHKTKAKIRLKLDNYAFLLSITLKFAIKLAVQLSFSYNLVKF